MGRSAGDGVIGDGDDGDGNSICCTIVDEFSRAIVDESDGLVTIHDISFGDGPY